MRMMRITGALVMAGLIAVGGTAAQEPDRADGDLAEALARANASLARIADALEGLQTRQDTDILLRRIEIAERRLGPLRSDLRSARSTVRATKEERQQLQIMVEQWEREREEALLRGEEADGLEAEKGRVEAMLENLSQRLEEAERRVTEAEIDLNGREREIDRLDAQLRELLEN